MEACLQLSGEGVGTQVLRSEEDALRSAGPEEEARDLHAAFLSGHSGSHYKGGNSGAGVYSDLHRVRTRMCMLVLTHSNLGLDLLLLFLPATPVRLLLVPCPTPISQFSFPPARPSLCPTLGELL